MTNSDTFKELRGYLDGQDTFMTGGHQVIKPRQSNRETPDWATSNNKIQVILLRSFPKLRTNLTQRKGAARWAEIIQLYYRMHVSKRQIAEQLKLNYNTVRMLVRNISRAAKGKKANGVANTNRPTGRPKKKTGDTPRTALGVQK
jgi:hypothetical protein